jgi:hypothetical protein
MISLAMYFSLWIGTSALAWTYGNNGFTPIAWGLMTFGLVWTFTIQRDWTWFGDVALISFTLAAAAGIYLALPFSWMLAGNIGALITHDLSKFSRRLNNSAQEDDTRRIKRAHITRLGVLLILGITLSSAAVLWQTQISFEWIVIFVLVVVLGLNRLLSWLR